MQTFDELLAKFRSRHPKIGETEAMTLIAEAYRNLTAEYRWPFLIAETVIQTEAKFTSGTIAVGLLGTAVTFTAGADGLLWSAAWKNRRIVIQTRGEVYKITITGTTTGTIAPAWAGDAQTAATFVMFRSEYPMPNDCDYGMDVTFVDVRNNLPFTIVSAYDMLAVEAFRVGEVGYPEALARVQIEQEVSTNNPLEMIRFFPAPDAVYSFPAFYYRKVPAATSTAKPIWPENYEDLIPSRAEILLEQNPNHRVKLSDDMKQFYASRLWDLKKRGDGGAEVNRRIQTYQSGGWGLFFQNVNFTPSGFNPLVGV